MKLKKIGDNLYQRQDGSVQDREGKIIHDRKNLVDKVIDMVKCDESAETDGSAPESQ